MILKLFIIYEFISKTECLWMSEKNINKIQRIHQKTRNYPSQKDMQMANMHMKS